MLSNPAPVGAPPTEVGDQASSTVRLRRALLAFGACAAAVYLVMGLVAPHLPAASGPHLAPPFSGPSWLRGWAQWDSGWYYRIATDGYSYVRGQQSTIAFFPAYPLLVRPVAALVANAYVAGIVVTLAAGAGVALLFFAWLRARLSPPAAWTALAAFLLYPYAFYLYGVVYADAVFIAALLGAFLLLESDHPWLAGLAGAVATAARPLGPVVTVGLLVRALERRGALCPAEGGVLDLRRARAADAGVLLSVLGLGAWCAYLWARFGDPVAFLTDQEAWHQGAGPATWLKVQFFKDVVHVGSPLAWLVFVAHAVLTLGALVLLPRVFRRFGLGYGVYTVLLIGVASLSTKNFFGMARYLLAAFPCFAVLGELLAERPALRRLALPAGGAGLLVLTAVFGTGYYLS
jgi:hypothetical protein